MADTVARNLAAQSTPVMPARKKDADYVFYELTRSICPECRRVIDAQILLRDNKVYMRKRYPDHGTFEALVYGDAKAYTAAARFNKPGTIPLKFTTEIAHGCPQTAASAPTTSSTPASASSRSTAPATWPGCVRFQSAGLVALVLL